MSKRKTNKPYEPIDCGLHSQYELAIIRQQALRLTWKDNHGQTHQETVFPKNLRTRWHSEFLISISSNGYCRALRLDRIISFDVI